MEGDARRLSVRMPTMMFGPDCLLRPFLVGDLLGDLSDRSEPLARRDAESPPAWHGQASESHSSVSGRRMDVWRLEQTRRATGTAQEAWISTSGRSVSQPVKRSVSQTDRQTHTQRERERERESVHLNKWALSK